jgi:hypothetical protein
VLNALPPAPSSPLDTGIRQRKRDAAVEAIKARLDEVRGNIVEGNPSWS